MTETSEIVWRGPEALRPLLVPISSISPWPANPRLGDAGAVAASLARFGQQKPIVVQRSTGWIVAGNHTWYAAAMVGDVERALQIGPMVDWTHIAAVFSDLGTEEAVAYAVADNRTSDLGHYDDDKLAKVLVELASAGALLGTGYDGDDVDELLASLQPFIPDSAPARSEPTIGSEVLVEVRCSRVFLEEISATLADWQRRDGVEVSVA